MTVIKVLNTLAEMYLILCTNVLHYSISRHLLYGETSCMHGLSVTLAHFSTQNRFTLILTSHGS